METYLTDLRWGTFNLIKGDMISNIASHYGEWADVEVSVFQQILKSNSNVIEVGSNIGLHTIPLAKMVPQGKLICFEPQAIIFQQLCCNLALNNLTNVETYRMGVSDKTTKKWIETSDYSQPWNYGSFSLDKGFSTENPFSGTTKQTEIDVISLDDFLPVQRLDSLSLLKIDAEGLDIHVLQGAKQTIKHFQPIIFIEVHSHSIDSTLMELHSQHYQAYWCASERYQPDNFNNAERIEFGSDINFLCIPNALEHLFVQPNNVNDKLHSLLNILVKAHSVKQLNNRCIYGLHKMS